MDMVFIHECEPTIKIQITRLKQLEMERDFYKSKFFDLSTNMHMAIDELLRGKEVEFLDYRDKKVKVKKVEL